MDIKNMKYYCNQCRREILATQFLARDGYCRDCVKSDPNHKPVIDIFAHLRNTYGQN